MFLGGGRLDFLEHPHVGVVTTARARLLRLSSDGHWITRRAPVLVPSGARKRSRGRVPAPAPHRQCPQGAEGRIGVPLSVLLNVVASKARENLVPRAVAILAPVRTFLAVGLDDARALISAYLWRIKRLLAVFGS